MEMGRPIARHSRVPRALRLSTRLPGNDPRHGSRYATKRRSMDLRVTRSRRADLHQRGRNSQVMGMVMMMVSSGRLFNPLAPEGEISIEEIAEGVAKEPRWSGQSPNFIESVAEHLYIGSYHTTTFINSDKEGEEDHDYTPWQYALEFLLHDACEGLGLHDMNSNLKRIP